ncbi:unnamed protein product, partial [Rotaria sp. Silwood2]
MVTISTGDGSVPSGIAVGDFNGDCRLDIVLTTSFTDNVGILLEYGNGIFTAMITYPTGDSSLPVAVTVGDFNSDDGLDIVVVNHNSSNVAILLGYSNGSFANQVAYSTGTRCQPWSVAVGDVNNDKRLDLAVANYNIDNVGILLGHGTGTFAAVRTYSSGVGSGPSFISAGDFNKDNRLDIAVANSLSNNISVFLGSGSEPFTGITAYATGDGSRPHSVAVGDFNNDGRSDIIVANYGTNNVGIFKPMMNYSTGDGSAPFSVAVDLNGTFTIGEMYSTGDRFRPYTIVISDFNNDNRSDLAIVNSGTNNVLLFYGFGNEIFGNEISYPLG